MILRDLRQSPSISNISLFHASKRSMTGLQYFGFILTAFLAIHLKIHVLAGTSKTLFSICSVRPVLLFVSYHCLLVYGFCSESLRLNILILIDKSFEQTSNCLDTLCRTQLKIALGCPRFWVCGAVLYNLAMLWFFCNRSSMYKKDICKANSEQDTCKSRDK